MARTLEYRVTQLERNMRDVEKKEAETQRLIHNHDTNLATIILKLENIAENLKTVTSNFKEAIERSNKRQEEEREHIKIRLDTLEKKVINLDTKLENEKDDLSKKVDERTIEKDSNLVQMIIKDVIWLVLGGMLTYFATMLFK